MKKKGKFVVDCRTCGGYSIRRTDTGFIQGCTPMGEFLKEESPDLWKDNMGAITRSKDWTDFYGDEQKANLEVHPIDTQFLLNRNGDCPAWFEQTPTQKQAIKNFRRFSRKYNGFLNKVKRWLNW